MVYKDQKPSMEVRRSVSSKSLGDMKIEDFIELIPDGISVTNPNISLGTCTTAKCATCSNGT